MTWSARSEAAWSSARHGAGDLDPVDLLALDEAADAPGERPDDATGDARRDGSIRLAVFGDRTGALTFAAADRFGANDVRVFSDEVDVERAIDALAAARAADESVAPVRVRRFGLEPELVSGATLVLGRLPKHHAQLEELAALIATHADAEVRFVGAGRVKHMSRGLNDVLALGFDEVRASLGRQKSRALHAWAPRRDHGIDPFPRWASVPELGVEVAAHGGAFAGASLDIGTRALLDALEPALEASGVGPDFAGDAVDLGCGTGLIAVALAAARPGLRVTATDRSWAACASAAATAVRAGADARVTVLRDDAASTLPDSSVDLVVLNPPFHEGTELAETAAEPLFAAAARILRPGGSLVTVFNAHLPHRTPLRRMVGPTEQVSRTPKFVVTRSVVPARDVRDVRGGAGRGGPARH
ncbi:MAG: class I SAM-dependent methyltransferase [Pseudoclavibacter sp.]